MNRAGTLLLALFCACSLRAEPPVSVLCSDGRYAMGTVLEISISHPEPVTLRPLFDEAYARVDELESLFSRYREDSEVSRLAREAGASLRRVDPATARLLRQAVDYAERSGGAFDVTVGPLVALWTRAAERDRIPEPAEIDRALALVGAAQIRVEGERAGLARSGMSIDLGGIAKGFALDELVANFSEVGVEDALLSFGQSSLWALGHPPDAPGWRVALRVPEGVGGENAYAGVVTLRDKAFSVSSSFGRSSRIGGTVYGHVVDPRDGHAVSRPLQAAVVALSAATAEAVSTALIVLGPAKGIALATGWRDVEARIVGERAVQVTPGWFEVTGFRAATPAGAQSGER